MTTQTLYPVVGMTCGHCVNAVTTELQSLAGVTDIGVDLHPSGISSVSVISESELPYEVVAAAIEEAGYALADSAPVSPEPRGEADGCCGGAGHSSSVGLHQIVKAGGCCGGSGS